MRIILLAVLALFINAKSHAQNGLRFDGTNDYVQTNFTGITGANARTVEAWIKPYFTSTQKVIASWGTMSPNGTRFTFNLTGGTLRIEIGGQGFNGSTFIADTTWHHVAVVYDPSATLKFKLYVDGALDGEANLSTYIMNTSSTGPMVIGTRTDLINNFQGWIDEVRVWDYARSQTEISINMSNEFCGLPTGLVSYFKLNQGIANGTNTGLTTAIDQVNSLQNGTLTGFSLSGSASNWSDGYPLTQGASFYSLTVNTCGSYTVPSGNATYTMPGNYSDTINTVFGCDSIISINLASVAPNSFATINESACSFYTVPSGNATYNESGTYNDTIPSASGCDSIITINLTIEQSAATISASSCYSYTSPSGTNTWTSSGTYQDTIANSVGCDSILTINLQIKGTTTSNITETACFEYTTPSGKLIENSGTVLDTIANANGCDSVITINLTVKKFNNSVFKSVNALICSVQGATYQWINCEDKSEIVGETAQAFLITQSGSYAVVATKDGCTDTSTCENVVIIGLNEIETQAAFMVFPNPSNGLVSIQAAGSKSVQSVSITNALGELVMHEHNIGSASYQLQLEVESGLYFITITDTDGNTATKSILKQ
jgi:hypothetical protein